MTSTSCCVAQLTYQTIDQDGHILDSTGNKPLDLVIGRDPKPTPLEQAVLTMFVGEQRDVVLQPEQAFGAYNPELVRVTRMPGHGFEEGDDFTGPDNLEGYVRRVNGSELTIDYNHPFAGKTLTIRIHLLNKRSATTQEILSGMPASTGNACCGPEGCC